MFAHFNHSQIRKYIIAFGKLFSNVEVIRTNDATGVEVQRFKVPIEYGPKERWFTRQTQDPQLKQGARMVVPRMGYDIKNITYDPSRHQNSLTRLTFPTNEARKLARMYVGVPYRLTLELSVLTKLQADGMQIVEQILPYFTPDLTFALNVVPELGLIDTIPVTMTGINCQDNYEGDFEKNRMILWNLTFDMNVNFYGLRRNQSRIEEVLVDIFSVSDDLSIPPAVLATEDDALIENEDGSGHLVDESTPDTYIGTEVVTRITTTADPSDQDPISRDDITFTQTTEHFIE